MNFHESISMLASRVQQSKSDAESPRKDIKPRFVLAKQAMRRRTTQLGLGLVFLTVVIAIFGPYLAPHPLDAFVGPPFAKPGNGTLLGTDYLGQDVLSRVLWGGRTVLWMSVTAVAIAACIGVPVGLTAGYFRTLLLDEVPMRLLDVILAIPGLILTLLVVSMVGPSPWLITMSVAIAFVPSVARVTRGATLHLAEREFVQWAQMIGKPRRTIVFRELLPNIGTPVAVELGIRLRYAIGIVAGVSFLGLGIQPPAADWGLMMNQNRVGLQSQPWAVLVPLACIVIFTIGSSLVAEGLARTIAGVSERN